MTSFRKVGGFEKSSALKLNRPVVEQLAHFRFAVRMLAIRGLWHGERPRLRYGGQ